MKTIRRLATVVALALMSGGLFAATFLGPFPYQSRTNSPWFADILAGTMYLEDFEDGLFNTPGVIRSSSSIASLPAFNNVDSVDADDRVIDGSGSAGKSLFSDNNFYGLQFYFSAEVLGGLPKLAGLVWTDGDNPGNPHLVVFEAFDTNGITLGTNSATLGDSDNFGGTAEDRFFGVEHAGGISSIKIYGLSNGGIEIDHLQYSFTPTLNNCPNLFIRRSQNPQSQQVDICWSSTSGANYQIQYVSELNTNNWLNLGATVSGNGTTNCITDSYANGQPRRFYRLNCL